VLSVQAVIYGSILTYSLSSLQVSELAEEQELRDLFERFGRVTRVFLARDRETQRAKGFAFISYADRGDAARACEKMDGCMCLPLSRPWPRSPPWSSRDTRTNHLFSFLLQSVTATLFFASSLPSALLRFASRFPFHDPFLGWILFSFYLSGGPRSMLKLFPFEMYD
jgi:RNA recognition motif-containing protein